MQKVKLVINCIVLEIEDGSAFSADMSDESDEELCISQKMSINECIEDCLGILYYQGSFQGNPSVWEVS